MKKKKMVYILIQDYEYAEDGFNIIGVFETLKSLRNYVANKYPGFIKDYEGDYFKVGVDSYLTIYKKELIG